MKNKNIIKLPVPVLTLALAILIGGCSSNPPVDKMSVAEHLLEDADVNKSPQYSPLEMRIARENFEAAKAAMADEDYDKARRLAEKVAVDVETASAKADSIRAKNAVDELKRSLDTLRQELNSKNNS
ncbi:conserved hypothetical protein [Candidatus Methylobacter favarea]|uniref:DUF4398 domain-containing protein n=1 Tax=Candidatus Methylobacter favarea TaxID=2707345 RepID=A0A8S0X6E5_9GAMM|nr:DUF4398 domain-containing protein [Candidatus Methylobacter favarea]CAA9889064.1 conserved hypothetical protein [Candidatus Methylobacter favarea]